MPDLNRKANDVFCNAIFKRFYVHDLIISVCQLGLEKY
jgi:hypothetical protein